MTESAPAWTSEELDANPHARDDKARKVRDMFTAIAGSYDLNNRLHSFGRDQAWRKKAVKLAALQPGDRVLDVACGTGDLTIAFRDALRKLGGDVEPVVGLDFTYAMLPPAVGKSGDGDGCVYLNGDALNLPFADQTFDVVSIAFGLRNVADPAAAVREFARVLRPGGRLVILEFSEPGNPVFRWGSKVWTDHVMPRTATWIARDRSGAYRYLPRSVATFLDRDGVSALFEASGFGRPVVKPVNFGVATIYVGRREV
ncbi:MAG: bifunctional demethylmenaquinone methyltransferase/2-methoxy-6-polyprenyl-1,4-benzoquinol methylase UbiE [Planctomycetota bacterium]